jgi:hypothetical protein
MVAVSESLTDRTISKEHGTEQRHWRTNSHIAEKVPTDQLGVVAPPRYGFSTPAFTSYSHAGQNIQSHHCALRTGEKAFRTAARRFTQTNP